MPGKNADSTLKRAREKYVTYTVQRIKLDERKRVTRSQRARGYTKYYRIYLKKKRR